jgi:hypothetical protein
MIRSVDTPKLVQNIRAVHIVVVILNNIQAEELNQTLVVLIGVPNLSLLCNTFNRLQDRQ